jgi:hypothetical protein
LFLCAWRFNAAIHQALDARNLEAGGEHQVAPQALFAIALGGLAAARRKRSS